MRRWRSREIRETNEWVRLMSRSYRKVPMMKGRSEKEFKQRTHRRLRRLTHMAIAAGEDPPDDKAFGDWWYSPSDGVVTFWHVPKEQRRSIRCLRK